MASLSCTLPSATPHPRLTQGRPTPYLLPITCSLYREKRRPWSTLQPCAPPGARSYVGKEVVKRAVPNEAACDELIQLIKDHNMWVEPPVPEPAMAMA